MPDSQQVSLECPSNKRNYMYCPIHELHSSHNNQASSRKNNTVVVRTTTTLHNSIDNTILANDIGTLLNGRCNSSRRKRTIARDGDEEKCMCGCNKSYDLTAMSDCKGENCTNRVHRRCVPNTWLCNICKHNKIS